jgi:4'-phosphopantetheinyl transferase EntD
VNVLFRLDLPHGRCVGVEIAAADELALSLRLPEQRFAAGLSEGRRATWIAGRVALRAALEDLAIETGPILATDRGAPLMPDDVLGSISHKKEVAVGLAARRENAAKLGVDLEKDAPLRIDIARRVLTEQETREVDRLSPQARQSEVLLRLSCKEAIYKAVDPFVRRYVGFQEATVGPFPDGRVAVALDLIQDEGPFDAEVYWRRVETAFGAFFLTSARVRPGPQAPLPPEKSVP